MGEFGEGDDSGAIYQEAVGLLRDQKTVADVMDATGLSRSEVFALYTSISRGMPDAKIVAVGQAVTAAIKQKLDDGLAKDELRGVVLEGKQVTEIIDAISNSDQ